MKRILSVLLVFSMLLTASAALAEGMDVRVIGEPETVTEPVSLDDFKLNAEAEIESYGLLTATEFVFKDRLGYYRSGRDEIYAPNDFYLSGTEADYALLRMDITNIATKPRDFLAACEVKVVFDDVYEYGGWFHQYNYNNKVYSSTSSGEDSQKQNTNWVINAADHFAIDPMYQGHFVFGCTLPNAVVNSKAPLKMIITIDGNEITYNIRK